MFSRIRALAHRATTVADDCASLPGWVVKVFHADSVPTKVRVPGVNDKLNKFNNICIKYYYRLIENTNPVQPYEPVNLKCLHFGWSAQA